MNLIRYLKELKYLRLYIISIVLVICLSYSVYLFFDDTIVEFLGEEDGFFENLTAICFIAATFLFFISYRRSKNILVLGLAVILFLGAGEEISWGQRIFHFETPAKIKSINVQREFNIHNLEVFNDEDLHWVKKTGWKRFLEINMLYRIFSVTYLICIPFLFFHVKRRLITNKKIKMPVAPFTLGIFFFISWAIFYSIKYYLLAPGKVPSYYLSAGEIFEFTASYIYFTVALYFYKRKDDKFLGEDIKNYI